LLEELLRPRESVPAIADYALSESESSVEDKPEPIFELPLHVAAIGVISRHTES
jgi:hypothetical protein